MEESYQGCSLKKCTDHGKTSFLPPLSASELIVYLSESESTPFKDKVKLVYCKGGQTLEEVAQRSCGLSILGDIENWIKP